MRRWVIAAALPLALLACNGQELARRQAALALFIGRDEAEVVRQFGVPQRVYEANGHRFISYAQVSTAYLDGPYPWGYGGPWFGGAPVVVEPQVCDTTFEIAAGRVVGATLRGNAC